MWKFQPWVMNVNWWVPWFLQWNLLLWRKCLQLSTILRLKETINTSTHPLRLVICQTEMSLEQWRGPCHLLPNTKDQSGPQISTWIQLVVPQTLILHSLSCVYILKSLRGATNSRHSITLNNSSTMCTRTLRTVTSISTPTKINYTCWSAPVVTSCKQKFCPWIFCQMYKRSWITLKIYCALGCSYIV